MGIFTVNGPLTDTDTGAGNDVDAGSDGVTLSAGSNGNDNLLDIQANAGVAGGAGVDLKADNMSIAAAIDAGTQVAFVRPFETGTKVDLGGADAAGTLGLTAGELNLISAGIINIGSATTGDINVTGVIIPIGTDVLSLQNDGNITDSVGASIQETNLAIRSTGSVILDEAHGVTNLAADLTGTGDLFFNGRLSNLFIGTTVAGISDVNVADGDVTLIGDDLNVATGGEVNSTTGNVTLQSRDDLTLASGSTVSAAGSITAQIDFDNSDANGQTATIAGTINATSMSVAGDTDSDTFNITPSSSTPISVDGNDPIPPASPGDTLNVDLTGTTGLNFTKVSNANGFSGSYAFSNRETVSYQEIETLIPDGTQLSIQMTDSPDPVAAGKTITYTITVNIGNAEAQNVVVSDNLPPNTTFVSFTAPAGWATATPPVGGTGLVTATRGTLAAGSAAQVFTLVVRVSGAAANNSIINNTATVTSSTNDFDPSDNTAQTATTVRRVTLPLVVGAGAGGGSQVNVYDPVTGVLTMSFNAYPGFGGGVQVAAGDVNGDGIADIVTGAGSGGGPHVKVFDGVTGAVIREFFAYAASFLGGVFVGVGDINNDGFGDIITGAGAGGGPHVTVVSGKDGSLLRSFFAYDANFNGGVRVAGGDVSGDFFDDIVTGAGPGGGPHVQAFSGTDGSTIRSFFAYAADFKGGVFVASGDVNDDGHADIITGAGAGGGPHVIVFSGVNSSILQSFFAYASNFTGGVRVAVADNGADGDLDLVTGAGPGGGPHVRVLNASNLAEERSFFAFDPSFLGGVFVG
jgi:uncharacterized repeat protein (TIGR01451 family)